MSPALYKERSVYFLRHFGCLKSSSIFFTNECGLQILNFVLVCLAGEQDHQREDDLHGSHGGGGGRGLAPAPRVPLRQCRRRSQAHDLGHQVIHFYLYPPL
jgi:hypothetical protein